MDISIGADTYGKPPESCAKECEALCKGRTVDELYSIADYFRKEGDDLDNKIDSTITADDFEKAKKDTSTEIPTEEGD